MNKVLSKYIKTKVKDVKNQKILVAVSGGVDSMVLLHCCIDLNLNVFVAHVNYNLRKNSFKEQQLVEQYCKNHNVLFDTLLCSPDQVVDMKNSNLQEKARNIRYAFFTELYQKHLCNYIFTAHHLNDRIESFFLDALRGRGLSKLSGMKEVDLPLIRPFLQVKKEQILEYALVNNVPYFDDASNFESTYDRNYIRNQVLPGIENRFSNYESKIATTLSNLQSSAQLLNHLVDQLSVKYLSQKDDKLNVHFLDKIALLEYGESLLFYLIRHVGFNSSDCKDILTSVENGAYFSSYDHEAIRYDNQLIIRRKKPIIRINIKADGVGKFYIKDQQKTVALSIVNQMEETDQALYIDCDKLKFPLQFRSLEMDDKFIPLGMKGKFKGVKKFLKDLRISRFDRDETLVGTSEGNIFCVLGYRIDDRFKVTDDAVKILKIELEK